MAKAIFLGILCVLFVLQPGAASYVSLCLDWPTSLCTAVRVIAREEPDVEEALRYYVSAQFVDLHANLIERFPTGVLQSMSQLETLNLSYNLLKEIQLSSASDQQLQTVDLTYNNLERIDVPVSVITFVAVRNKLYTISVPANNHLKTLTLSMNKLDSFRGFENLKQIIELDLSCNQIKQIDVSILSGMSQLRNLNLANNHIHSVSGSGSIQSLQTLDLSNNILTMVEESFNGFSAVNQLSLRNNKIVMWLHDKINMRQLHNWDIRQNDWDCKSLGETLDKYDHINITRESCSTLENRNGICCTTSASPYADRLIKYRQQEHRALKIGTKQLQGEINCQDYVPSPCDRDDSLGYTVPDPIDIPIHHLQVQLQHEKHILASMQRKHEDIKAQTARIVEIQHELADFILSKYTAAGLSGHNDEVEQLDALFAHYNADIDKLKAEISKQDRLNQDKLNELNLVNDEIDELYSRKDSLMEEINKRNSTVIEYRRKIAELKQEIKARDQGTQ